MPLRVVFLVIVSSFFVCHASAVQVVFENAPGRLLYQTSLLWLPTLTVGEATLQALRQSGLVFEAEDEGVSCIEASDQKFDQKYVRQPDGLYRFYGWCYTVDGNLKEELMDHVRVPTATSTIRWFYSYAIQFWDHQWEYCKDHL